MTAPPAQLMTVADVAAYVRVSEYTVRQWIASGDLPAGRAGDQGRLRVDLRDLRRFLGFRDDADQALEPQPVEVPVRTYAVRGTPAVGPDDGTPTGSEKPPRREAEGRGPAIVQAAYTSELAPTAFPSPGGEPAA